MNENQRLEVIAKARQYVMDCYEDDGDWCDFWSESRPDVVLPEARNILQEDLQDDLDPKTLRFLADVVEVLAVLEA